MKKERPWCKCDEWYESVELDFILWDEKGYYFENESGMSKNIKHCPFCGRKLVRT